MKRSKIHHVLRMFLGRLSCLALSLVYLNLKHRVHILEEYSYSKVGSVCCSGEFYKATGYISYRGVPRYTGECAVPHFYAGTSGI